jgi:hypothetical protein
VPVSFADPASGELFGVSFSGLRVPEVPVLVRKFVRRSQILTYAQTP